MTGRLLSVADMLAPALAMLKPVPEVRIATHAAMGVVSAVPILAPRALPSGPVALRGGHAVAALDLVGASPHSPVMLAAMPPLVRAGDTLPDGTDAILPPEGITDEGVFAEVTRAVAPGDHVRLTGHDLIAGTILIPAGEPLAARHLLVLEIAGIDTIRCRRPALSLPEDGRPEAAWLAAACHALGCRMSKADEPADLAFGWSEAQRPMLALAPGDAASIRLATGQPPLILLPERFDGMIAAFAALALPLIARLADRVLRSEIRPLARKIASGVGLAEIVLLRTVAEGYLPLAIGSITLAALAEADCIALIPPESEGAAAGAMLAAWPLDFSTHCQAVP